MQMEISANIAFDQYSRLLKALDTIGDSSLIAIFEVNKDKPEAKVVPEASQPASTAQSMLRR
jgi:hypothetical protein